MKRIKTRLPKGPRVPIEGVAALRKHAVVPEKKKKKLEHVRQQELNNATKSCS